MNKEVDLFIKTSPFKSEPAINLPFKIRCNIQAIQSPFRF